MKLFPYLASKTNLTLEELELYYELKVVEIVNYDPENVEHEVIYK